MAAYLLERIQRIGEQINQAATETPEWFLERSRDAVRDAFVETFQDSRDWAVVQMRQTMEASSDATNTGSEQDNDDPSPNTPTNYPTTIEVADAQSLEQPGSLNSSHGEQDDSPPISCNLPSPHHEPYSPEATFSKLISLTSNPSSHTPPMAELQPLAEADAQPTNAQQVIDRLEEEIDGLEVHNANYGLKLWELSKLCDLSAMLPSGYKLSGDIVYDGHVNFCGGTSDVYRARYNGTMVAVKVLRAHVLKDDDLWKYFCKEAVFLKRLEHPNIVRFLGVLDTSQKLYAIVSEWMTHGDIRSYMKNNPGRANKLRMMQELADPLAYIHKRKVMHGDIKGPNILVNACGRACLGDFGLAVVLHNTGIAPSMSSYRACTIRWAAPERLETKDNPNPRPIMASDVYSFGMTIWEVFAEQLPFSEARTDYRVQQLILEDKRPLRPAIASVSNSVWKIIESCWEPDWKKRPTAAEVASGLLEC